MKFRLFLIEIMFCELIGMAHPNDDTELGNNVPHNPPPNDLAPPKICSPKIPYPLKTLLKLKI